ncbi:MAG: holo-ACP synthase [Chitinispirillaceae bacterium]|nr:holo-ACP synthase [Chitinispirillaceae bacterium]
MIIGIGTDIASIARMRSMIKRYGCRFLERVFTRSEIAYCTRMADPAVHFAARWAAKEAFYKALPDSLQKQSSWKSIQVTTIPGTRRPNIEIPDRNLQEQCQRTGISSIHCSLSHEQDGYSVAFVVLEGKLN